METGEDLLETPSQKTPTNMDVFIEFTTRNVPDRQHLKTRVNKLGLTQDLRRQTYVTL